MTTNPFTKINILVFFLSLNPKVGTCYETLISLYLITSLVEKEKLF